MKNRSLNELRQTRDAVYVQPRSYEERMEDRKVGMGYIILDAAGTPCVTCDDISCILEARPTLNAEEINAHFFNADEPLELPNGEVIRPISRRKRSA